jgi:hypothetical protein
MNTFLSNVYKNDIFYLTSKANIAERQFGWNCMDDETNIAWKYIHFIYNMTSILHYDWYIFIYDDTFVFIDRLEKLLHNYNKNDNYYIGNELNYIQNDFCLYMSGGAGFAISNGLYNILHNYVKLTGINNSHLHCHDDLCIGLWINKLKQDHNILQIDNKDFLIEQHKNDYELNNAITVHHTVTEEAYNYYYNIFNTINISNTKNKDTNTVFVLVTDLSYFNRAKRTIIDLRSKGEWTGDIVVITIGFHLHQTFKEFYNIIEKQFEQINTTNLLASIGENGFSNSDKREITKLNQWEKLHVFDDYFMKWNRVVFLDAGLRILDTVTHLLELDYKNKILAPKDGKYYENQTFKCQLSYDDLEKVERIKADFGEDILNETYFLNCIWIYDTSILNLCDKSQLIEAMNKYTLCKTNEMGIMNLLLKFKYKLWEPFPRISTSNKILFDWCELNNLNTTWKDYCYIKYPVTITFDDC